MQNRGVQDLLILAIENLVGFREYIEAVFPKADVQLGHQVCNFLRHITSQKLKAVVANIKPISQAPNSGKPEQKLIDFAESGRKNTH